MLLLLPGWWLFSFAQMIPSNYYNRKREEKNSFTFHCSIAYIDIRITYAFYMVWFWLQIILERNNSSMKSCISFVHFFSRFTDICAEMEKNFSYYFILCGVIWRRDSDNMTRKSIKENWIECNRSETFLNKHFDYIYYFNYYYFFEIIKILLRCFELLDSCN